MDKWLPTRYLGLAIAVVVFVLALARWPYGTGWQALAAIFGVLTAIGLVDLAQKRSTLRRNYPLLAHIRFFFEGVRPMLRQYIVESDNEEVPFSHVQRAVVKQRAKNALDVRPFGTELDVYAERYEWINHSIVPSRIDSHDFRVTVGNAECTQPYSASVFNISAMSFGAISPNAIRALNEGARRGDFRGNFWRGQHAAMSGLRALRELELDHLDLRQLRFVRETRFAEHAGTLAGAEITRAQFPDDVAAVLAVVWRQ